MGPRRPKEGILSGIIGGFLVTGVGGLFLSAHLLKNPQKAEQTEIMKTEERTRFLRVKTQSAVHFVALMIVSAGTLVALICGYRDIALALSALLIIEVILYICFGTYYAKKY
jgi:uncharacterized membrane protein